MLWRGAGRVSPLAIVELTTKGVLGFRPWYLPQTLDLGASFRIRAPILAPIGGPRLYAAGGRR
jgi:hypothetical protein